MKFAVERRMRGKNPDYWDHATAIELAVLSNEPDAAKRSLQDALRVLRERWHAKSTANNLRLIDNARKKRNEAAPWLNALILALDARGEA